MAIFIKSQSFQESNRVALFLGVKDRVIQC